MAIFEGLSRASLDGANSLLGHLTQVPQFTYVIYGSLAMILWLTGRQLARFSKPDAPYISPIVRSAGSLAGMCGRIMLAAAIGLLAILLSLVELSYALSPTTDGMQFAAIFSKGLFDLWNAIQGVGITLVTGVAIGLFLSLPLVWRLIPQWERGEGLPDVKELVRSFKKLSSFDPMPYIDVSRGCFIGLESSGTPIYIPWQKLRETHGQVLGMSGSGKGVAMSLIAYQCAIAGECVIWFDPKHDRYSPRILKAAAKQCGRAFHLLNLNPDQPPQFNLLAGAKAYEIEELFVAGFDLRAKGSDGDYHRGKDEDAAIEAGKLAIDSGAKSIPELFLACANVDAITEQENFWRHFRKLMDLPAVNTDKGLDLVKAISRGDIIYVVGSADNERVKMLQKMLLARVMQIIKSRERLESRAAICCVLDEFKHIISPIALTQLGVARDFDTHFLLAHQSLGDLDACPGVSHAEAYGAVVDNTAIKIIYKVGDGDYAEKLAKGSGKRRTYTDNSAKSLDDAGASGGGWRETNIPHINPDLITHLPMPTDRNGQASTGILFGIANAKLFHVGPIPTVGPLPTPVAAPAFAHQGIPGIAKELI